MPFADEGGDEHKKAKLSAQPSALFQTNDSQHLDFIDKDGDGVVTKKELEQFVSGHHDVVREKELFKKAFFMLLIMLMGFSACIVALTFVVVEETKESHVDPDSDVMVSAETGNTVQCGSADFVVEDGVLTLRNDVTRRLAESDNTFLDPSAANALATRNVYKKRQLQSTMPNKHFKDLEWLELESPSGSILTLKILSISRIPNNNARCGTYLKLGTANGIIVLDDDDIYYDDRVSVLFEEAGFNPLTEAETEVSSNSTRRLLSPSFDSSSGGGKTAEFTRIRRLQGLEFTLVGFFNLIDDAPWTCESVEKPEMPTNYVAHTQYYRACKSAADDDDDDEEENDSCSIEFRDGIKAEARAVITMGDDNRYMVYNRSIYANENVTVIVDDNPLHFGVKRVTMTYADGYFKEYQVGADGVVSNCKELFDYVPTFGMPSDYNFYFLPDEDLVVDSSDEEEVEDEEEDEEEGETENFRRFRISFLDQFDEWNHMDEFLDT